MDEGDDEAETEIITDADEAVPDDEITHGDSTKRCKGKNVKQKRRQRSGEMGWDTLSNKKPSKKPKVEPGDSCSSKMQSSSGSSRDGLTPNRRSNRLQKRTQEEKLSSRFTYPTEKDICDGKDDSGDDRSTDSDGRLTVKENMNTYQTPVFDTSNKKKTSDVFAISPEKAPHSEEEKNDQPVKFNPFKKFRVLTPREDVQCESDSSQDSQHMTPKRGKDSESDLFDYSSSQEKMNCSSLKNVRKTKSASTVRDFPLFAQIEKEVDEEQEPPCLEVRVAAGNKGAPRRSPRKRQKRDPEPEPEVIAACEGSSTSTGRLLRILRVALNCYPIVLSISFQHQQFHEQGVLWYSREEHNAISEAGQGLF